MKNCFLAFILLNAFLVTSCSEQQIDPVKPKDEVPLVKGCTDPLATNFKSDANDDDCSCEYTFVSNVSKAVPATITTKVLLEQMTGAWCGWCVDGTLRMNDLIATNPNKVIGAVIHQGDPMQNLSIFNALHAVYRINSFPSGMVNRKASPSSGSVVMNRGEWANSTTTALSLPVSMGVGIDASITGNTLTTMLHVANKTTTTDNYSLQAYLLEDGLVYSQNNYYSNLAGNSSHPFYSQPNPITNYVHNKVVRTMVTELSGISLPTAAKDANKIYRRLYTTNLGNYDKSKLRIVAFIVREGGEVVNAQELVLNTNSVSKNFD